jgi:hypothetical protein
MQPIATLPYYCVCIYPELYLTAVVECAHWPRERVDDDRACPVIDRPCFEDLQQHAVVIHALEWRHHTILTLPLTGMEMWEWCIDVYDDVEKDTFITMYD